MDFFFGEPIYIMVKEKRKYEELSKIIVHNERLGCSKYLEAFYQMAVKQEK